MYIYIFIYFLFAARGSAEMIGGAGGGDPYNLFIQAPLQ
jgi:hypothetical protein